MLQLTATFLGSLLFGFLGTACVFKLAQDLLVVAAGNGLNPMFDNDADRRIWTWPRDRRKIVANSLAAAMIGALCFGLSYFLAIRAFHAGS